MFRFHFFVFFKICFFLQRDEAGRADLGPCGGRQTGLHLPRGRRPTHLPHGKLHNDLDGQYRSIIVHDGLLGHSDVGSHTQAVAHSSRGTGCGTCCCSCSWCCSFSYSCSSSCCCPFSFPTFFVSVQAEPCGAHPQADRPWLQSPTHGCNCDKGVQRPTGDKTGNLELARTTWQKLES